RPRARGDREQPARERWRVGRERHQPERVQVVVVVVVQRKEDVERGTRAPRELERPDLVEPEVSPPRGDPEEQTDGEDGPDERAREALRAHRWTKRVPSPGYSASGSPRSRSADSSIQRGPSSASGRMSAHSTSGDSLQRKISESPWRKPVAPSRSTHCTRAA